MTRPRGGIRNASGRVPFRRGYFGVVAAAVTALAPISGLASSAPSASASVSYITEVSRGCAGQNAEVEQAVDPAIDYVYELWMGCSGGGIAFARSRDGGLHFDRPIAVPGAQSSWDPAISVAPNGIVYVAFMVSTPDHTYPVVSASFDHGASFPQVSSLVPKQKQNWGDRPFIAVGPDGVVYITWDYGPTAAAVTYICDPNGSCSFATGDLNVVIQKSTDGGKTWGPIAPISPGFPASGGDSAPMVIEPNGRIDVEYQGYHITNKKTYTMKPAHSYFTSSDDGGKTWSSPVRIGPANLTMSLAEWWIDGSIGMDSARNLYVTWDTQVDNKDIGWLAYSTDHGKHWSALRRVTPDTDNATHIVEVAGGREGVAYVAWLADSSPHGYAEYFRPFSIDKGWLSDPVQVSRQFGNRSVWPGDTFGISTLSREDSAASHQEGQRVVLSWGSATGSQPPAPSEIFATVLTTESYPPPQ